MSWVERLVGQGNQILVHEIEFAAYWIWPAAALVNVLLAPQGFYEKPWRALLYTLLGPIGTADLARRAMRARAEAAVADGETRPARVRWDGIVLAVLFLGLLGTGLVLALETTWPRWYFPLVAAHRWLGLGFLAAYLVYLGVHIKRYAGTKNLLIHLAFSFALVLVLLFVNIDSKLPRWALVSAVVTIFASAVWLRRLDLRTEQGKSRGGLLLNAYMLFVLASGFYLVPAVNVAISNNFGNYYYHLHGLVALFAMPLAAFLALHHVRRTPRGFPLPARIALVVVGLLFARHALTVADRKTHATEIEGYRNQGRYASGTLAAHQGPIDPPHEWWYAQMNEVANCQYCHDVLFKQWQGSAHALAGRNVFYREVLEDLVERGRLADTVHCQSCHQPALAVLGDRALATSPAMLDADQGVGCKTCHLMFELASPPRNGMVVFREEELSEGTLVPGQPYQPPPDQEMRDDLRLHLKSFSNSELFGSREFCASCHRIEIPGHPTPLPTPVVLPNPYDDTVAGAAPSEGPLCKGCHMLEDVANAKGIRFPNHHMFGINAMWSALLLPPDSPDAVREAVAEGDAATLAWLAGEGMTQAQLGFGVAADRPAFDLEVDWVGGATAEPAVVVDVLNARGGHPFPLGSLDLVDAWLYVRATRADGSEVLVSGQPDAEGHLPEGTRRYGARLVGPGGGPLEHHDILTVTGVADVNLLRPGQPKREEFRLSAADVQGYPLTVTAELRYRRARPGFVRDLDIGRTSVPTLVVASATCTILAPDGACGA